MRVLYGVSFWGWLAAACWSQVDVESVYEQPFDDVFFDEPRALPAGWSAVTAGQPVTAVGESDLTWAGRDAADGEHWAYNAALQFDLLGTGDSLFDRGLSVYASDEGQERYLELELRNQTGGVITALDVGFTVALYASQFDDAAAEARWDGFVLQVDDGSWEGFVTSPGLQAIFESSEVDFLFEGNPWTPDGQGWLSEFMFFNPTLKRRESGRVGGIAVPPGGVFRLRWVSRAGSVRPTPGAGLQQEMNIGVDDVVVRPVVSLGLGAEGYTQDFDAVFADGATEIPMGWAAVVSNRAVNAVGVSDEVWAGRKEDPPGTVWAYNAALQTDVTQVGDGLADRGLAIYSTDSRSTRYIEVGFLNETGATLTALDVAFNLALYAARFDSTDGGRPRWDGLFLEYSVNGGGFVRAGMEAIFENSEVTFGAAGSPWNADGWGWATAAMIPGGHKKTVVGLIEGVDVPAGGSFILRWASRDGAETPAPGNGVHQNMLVGVDDLRVTPVAGGPELPVLEGLVVEDGGKRYLAVRYERVSGGAGVSGIDYTADGVRYTVECSKDGGRTWASWPGGGGHMAVSEVSVVPAGAGRETVVVRLGEAIGDFPGQLARLRVTRVP